ncbi:uncharacterized protein LOC109594253 [Aethina tumida]|uniref:uncharacterized protein LOC109594253 n=1 Tax=Aethina tumida TaxID=116153 RepID=UPI00096B5A50|nr:uncharacterized protein LOC109594253 [Aethina tumida]
MAQGKLKVKTKVPQNVKTKKQKGSAITKRANCPIQSRKKKNDETNKLKEIITKTVNKAVEDEMRAKAETGQKSLSNAQKAVAAHNSKSK